MKTVERYKNHQLVKKAALVLKNHQTTVYLTTDNWNVLHEIIYNNLCSSAQSTHHTDLAQKLRNQHNLKECRNLRAAIWFNNYQLQNRINKQNPITPFSFF